MDSSHSVGMVTGDAPLTALHVADTLGITSKQDRLALSLNVSESGEVGWVGAIGPREAAKQVAFTCPGVVALSKEYDLITTEDSLNAAAAASNGEIWKEVQGIRVFARMSPQGKANIIAMVI